jgi:hypothetical protein
MPTISASASAMANFPSSYRASKPVTDLSR